MFNCAADRPWLLERVERSAGRPAELPVLQQLAALLQGEHTGEPTLPYPTLSPYECLVMSLCCAVLCCVLQCGGGGPVSGYLLSCATAVFLAMGPSVICYMPRVMPGCLLMHIGADLTIEGAALVSPSSPWAHRCLSVVLCCVVQRCGTAAAAWTASSTDRWWPSAS